jgi:hypothetical protein
MRSAWRMFVTTPRDGLDRLRSIWLSVPIDTLAASASCCRDMPRCSRTRRMIGPTAGIGASLARFSASDAATRGADFFLTFF